jgi:hypothetical protein
LDKKKEEKVISAVAASSRENKVAAREQQVPAPKKSMHGTMDHRIRFRTHLVNQGI